MEDLISREAAIDALRKLSREDGYIDMPHEYVTDAVRVLPSAQSERKMCNLCKYYGGVHRVQGHAPCSFWEIGGVMYDDYCSRWEEFDG